MYSTCMIWNVMNVISKKVIEYCKSKMTHAEHKNNQQHSVKSLFAAVLLQSE